MTPYECPYCGRNDFKKIYGLSNHINNCKYKPTTTTPLPQITVSNNYALPEPPEDYNPAKYDCLKLKFKSDRKWWIINNPDGIDIGPYDSKQEATEDMKGLQHSHRSMYTKGFVSMNK